MAAALGVGMVTQNHWTLLGAAPAVALPDSVSMPLMTSMPNMPVSVPLDVTPNAPPKVVFQVPTAM